MRDPPQPGTRPAGAASADDQQIGFVRGLEKHTSGRPLTGVPVHRHIRRCVGQGLFQRLHSPLFVHARTIADEQGMINGLVSGATPGAHGIQWDGTQPRLLEGEPQSRRHRRPHADGDPLVPAVTGPVVVTATDDDDRALGPGRHRHADGTQHHAGESAATAGAHNKNGRVTSHPDEGVLRFLPQDVGVHGQTRPSQPRAAHHGFDDVPCDHSGGRFAEFASERGPLVPFPQRGENDMQ